MQLAESMIRSAVKRKQDSHDQSCLKQRRDMSPHPVIDDRTGSQFDSFTWSSALNDTHQGQPLATSSHIEMTKKVQQLQQFLDKERKELRSFETYLNDIVAAGEHAATVRAEVDGRSNDFENSTTRDSRSFDLSLLSTSREYSLTDRIERLNAAVNSEKDADRLFEMQLMNVLLS